MLNFGTFRARLLTGILAPVILVNAVATIYELKHVKENFESRLISQGETHAASVIEPLTRAVWDFDSLQASQIVEGLVTTDTIAAVTVFDSNGSAQITSFADDFQPDDANIEQRYPLIHKSKSEAHPIGTMVLTLSYGEVRKAVKESVIRRATITGTVALLIVVSSSIILVGVSRPLIAMADIIPRIGTKDFAANIPAMSRHDELGDVAKALQKLQNNTLELNKIRDAQEVEAREDRHRIYHAIEATHDGILIFDRDGKVAYRNPVAVTLLGRVDLGSLISFSNYFDSEAAEIISTAVARNREFKIETKTIVAKKTFHLVIRGRAIRDADNTELGYSLVVHDQSAHVLEAAKTKYISEHDSLTGVGNRRLFEETLAQYVVDDSLEIGVLIADLDDFKRVNDTLGHPVGDALIKHVAKLIVGKVGDTELVARLGGDEFAIISRDSEPLSTLSRIAHDLISCLSAPQEVDQWVLTTGISAGIAKSANTSSEPKDVMRHADLALYEAKRRGRGCFEVFEGDLEARLDRKTELEKDLRKAINEGQITVEYQIQTDVHTGQIIGCEALARWSHERLGCISPAEFIPIAEEANLIEPLTIKVLMDVCTNARRLKEHGFTGRVAVNLSAMLFGTRLPELVDDVLFETNCSPTSIEAEITEGVFISHGMKANGDIASMRPSKLLLLSMTLAWVTRHSAIFKNSPWTR